MRLKMLPVALIISVALFTGCTSQPTQVDVPPNNSLLKQAQDQLPFKIVMPSSLPHDMELKEVLVGVDPNTGKPNSVNLSFASADNKYIFDVREEKGDKLRHLGWPSDKSEKEVTLNNSNAKFRKDEKLAIIHWTNGEILFTVQVGAGSDLASEEALVEIANRFK
ncbi:hypothetical protein [Effusibacillus lacus]|uniref:DUF4367 domain-containing protein n=1 Tax=Effusibacillus lacus TaxID=1348429 RepID=A0A292YKV5_9BACL|nr:hypothetical protein [Effusibacillus lacus]TCS70509.1 hypothetical protein EDD64_13240 [Effusibacillus lacus]GAX89541.1 hypothetical protein EFBL_1165 [Effusibacillus lacus]